MNDDYMNGYNSAIEKTLEILHQKMENSYHAHESIYSVLLDVKVELFDTSFPHNKEKISKFEKEKK